MATLTPKQQLVLDALDRGQTPPAIAKKLKISASGVYGHIRNIRKAGFTIPGESLGANGGAPAAPIAPVETNGEALAPERRSAEQYLDEEMNAAQAEVAALGEKIDGLNGAIELAEASKAALLLRIEKLDAARSALT